MSNDHPALWADKAMYDQDERFTVGKYGVEPKVSVLWMTPDPLGAVASFNAMYSGKIIRSLDELNDDERLKALDDVQQTHLQAPLENIKLQILVEGVDRSFTHQLVRQRTAVYAQESMRFAVVNDLSRATTMPPSLMGLKEDHPWRVIWDGTIDHINRSYHQLVNAGMPAEDARGLLPHATATRIHWVTDMRNLIAHSGNRLCTQAQFHWRFVFSQLVTAIAEYGQRPSIPEAQRWQYEEIAHSNLFKPVCYQIGRCPFNASFDRGCRIRERVEQYAAQGVPSEVWTEIRTEEWLMDPSAAREQ